jgi:Zn-dependent peptidase ImmA (M78 family)
MVVENKAKVLNPITLFNTVGQELADILQAQNKAYDEFMKFMDWGKELSDIKKLTKKEISKISVYFNIEGLGSYLESFQDDYRKTEEESNRSYREKVKLFSKYKKILPLLRNEFTGGMDILEDISDFFDIEDEEDIFVRAENNVALYRTASFKPDSINLYAWMRRGELDFLKLNLSEYNRSAFELWIENGEWRDCFTDEKYFKKLPEILKNFGVGLVFTPYLEKTVYGAVRWFDGKPLIQISDKGKNLAVCWHTFFHEIGHVLLHENDTIFEGEIESKTKSNKKEKEANDYAYKKLFNGDKLRKHIFSNVKNAMSDVFITQTSSQFNVPIIFVAYWMSRAQIKNRSINNYLFHITF